MSDTPSTLALAAGFGIVAGMRSMSAPALLSRRLRHLPAYRVRRKGRAVRLLASRRTAAVLTALAAGEMVADKMPGVPARTDPPGLMGRAVMGALSGAAVAGWRGGTAVGAMLVGGAAAVASAHLAYVLRRDAVRASGVPDPVVALAEDGLVVAAGSRLAAAV